MEFSEVSFRRCVLRHIWKSYQKLFNIFIGWNSFKTWLSMLWYSSVCESNSIKSRLSVNDWYCMNVWNTSQIPKAKAHILQSYNPSTCFFRSCYSKAVIFKFRSLYHNLIFDSYSVRRKDLQGKWKCDSDTTSSWGIKMFPAVASVCLDMWNG